MFTLEQSMRHILNMVPVNLDELVRIGKKEIHFDFMSPIQLFKGMSPIDFYLNNPTQTLDFITKFKQRCRHSVPQLPSLASEFLKR